MKFKRYEKYKSSDIDWLGEIPEGWENYRINWISKIVRGNTGFKKDELLDNGEYIALQYGKTYKVDEINKKFKFYVNNEFFKTDQLVHYGDTILISTSETIEDLGHSCFYNRNDVGLIGGEQILLKPNNKFIFEKYLYYYSKVFYNELTKCASGLKVFRYGTDNLKNIFIPLPSTIEQKQITTYLDKQTSFIDKKIELLKAKKQKYTELKKILISETVTKGLDKNVAMKDSGIEWIGQIPKHWEVKRLKDNVICFNGGAFKESLAEEGLPIIKIKQLVSSSNAVEFCNPDSPKINNGNTIQSGDLLFSWSTLLYPFIYEGSLAVLNQHIFKLKYSKHLHKKFLYYKLIHATDCFRSLAHGSTMKHIMKFDFDNLNYSHPAKSEQIAIASYLDEKTSKIDKITQTIDKNILALQEYRKTLINDVVTGKVKII
jgi:type I restriction enzyme, S subunit